MTNCIKVIIALHILTITLHSQSQSFEKIAPKPVSQETQTPEREAPGSNYITKNELDDTFIENLIGIQLIPHPDHLEEALANKATGININYFSIPNQTELIEYLKWFMRTETSISDIRTIGELIMDHYKQYDRPVVTILTPTQDVTDGIVTLIVLEGRVGKIYSTGAEYFDGNRIASEFRIQPGDTISKKQIDNDLKWNNKNPFRHVQLIYEPGEEFGKTNLNVHIDDRLPLEVYSSYANTGNEATGLNHWSIGGTYGNMLNRGHLLGLQLTSSGSSKFLSGAATYSMPFYGRTNLFAFASHTRVKSEFENIFSQKGNSTQTGIRWNKELSDWKKIRHEIEIGLDLKRSKNGDLIFSGIPVSDTRNTTLITQAVIKYLIKLDDKYGQTTASSSLFLSPSGIFANNKTEDFEISRSFTDANYAYARFDLERTTILPHEIRIINRFTAQYSPENLLSSEQLFSGGANSVRGYAENIALGDEGILISMEVHAPPISLLNKAGVSAFADALDIYTFWDYANVRSNMIIDGEDKSTTLSSIGLGLRYNIYPYFSLGIEYGRQLKRVKHLDAGKSQLHVSGVVSY